jgi:signal transduction histidine kinase
VVRTVKYDLEDATDVSRAIIRYVHRTKETLVLDNASQEGDFKNNPEVQAMGLRSVLCLPLIRQARLMGILYLENRLSDSVFTSEKAKMTELLTAQAGISLENARLVDEMRQAEETLRQHRGHLEHMVEERTRELQKTQQELIMAEKHAGVGRLAAGVAHEIKNQLTPILTDAQRTMAQIEAGKELSSQYIMDRVRTIEEASRTANKITMALLDYARESKPEFSRFSIKDSIEMITALHQSDRKWADVRIVLGEVEIDEIFADKRQIEQVLLNIINTGCEAIVRKGEPGIIDISVKKKDSFAVISIRDNGIGIPEEDQGRIFDPFFTTRGPRGVGLGLSVSYGIVERHGGRIDFESDPGKGSTFKVYLPISKTEKEGKGAISTQDLNM